MKPWLLAAAFAAMSVANAQNPPEPRVRSVVGDVRKLPEFRSEVMGNERDVHVYLPPGYDANPERRYPVLYMLDGQNVFDGMTSYIPNQEWQADEAAERMIAAGEIEPLIIVAIDNRGAERADEYLPVVQKYQSSSFGGRAGDYGKFLVTELKAFIDANFRTKPEPRHTGLMGSSFGGVATCFIGLSHPGAFGKLAIVSPSVWVGDRYLVRFVQGLEGHTGARVWMDMGTEEGTQSVFDAKGLAGALVGKGWTMDHDLRLVIDEGAKHNEAAWAKRLPDMLRFLFPPTGEAS